MRRIRAAAISLLLTAAASAQDGPIVTVDVTPEELLVGESAQLRVTVLVPTWFPSPPVFPSFELSNAITRLPPDSSFPTSQRIGRDTWSGIVRNYRVYPLLGANYRLTGQTIAVTYANPGADPIRVDVDIPDIAFRGVVPTGAESLDPYIAGRDFTLQREVEGDPEALQAGDALVVRYIAELDGLPAMFIPPLLPDFAAAGMSVYADEPAVEDGEPARRTEILTLVFDAGGEFTVPGIDLQWWSTADQQIRVASVDSLSLSVVGPPPAGVPTEAPVRTGWRSIVALVFSLGLLVVVARHALPAFRARRAAVRADRERSEQYAYRQLQQAIRKDDASLAYRRMLAWIARIAPGSGLRQFAREFGEPALQADLAAFLAALYSDSRDAPDLPGIGAGLAQARHACLRRHAVAVSPALPPLNP
jgi:hypothetical protein